MASRSGGSSPNRDNTSNALLPFEKKALQEARSFAIKRGTQIVDEKNYFADRGWWGLWWDAKGFTNSSDKEEVTGYLEKFNAFYRKIDELSTQVEEGDANAYERLVEINEELEEIEKDAESDVENNRSKTICRVLRDFLNERYKLDHNLKKVECVVLKQKIREVEKTQKSSRDAVLKLNETMENLIDENRGIKTFLETMKKEKEELASEANKRCDVIRQESEGRMKQLLMESEARIREMKKENDELRAEAERIRRESDERLKQAVEEANRNSESRMKKMAEKNDAALKKMTVLLEAMKIP